VPSIPSTGSLQGLAAQGSAVPPDATGFGGGGGQGEWVENTLDEPVWATLKRDVFTIGRNLRSVLIPINWDFTNSSTALGNWDLWGPLVRWGWGGGVLSALGVMQLLACELNKAAACFSNRLSAVSCRVDGRVAPARPVHDSFALSPQIFMLSLAITLSAGEKKPSDVFAVRVQVVWLGGGKSCRRRSCQRARTFCFACPSPFAHLSPSPNLLSPNPPKPPAAPARVHRGGAGRRHPHHQRHPAGRRHRVFPVYVPHRLLPLPHQPGGHRVPLRQDQGACDGMGCGMLWRAGWLRRVVGWRA
jgi:hypothetical protein